MITHQSPNPDWEIFPPARKCHESNARLPPKSWLSCFGIRSPRQWHETCRQYYLYIYAIEMSDLNWKNEECSGAVFETAIESYIRKRQGLDGCPVHLVNLFSKLNNFPDASLSTQAPSIDSIRQCIATNLALTNTLSRSTQF